MALQELYVALCLAVVAHLSVGSLLTCSGVRREFVLKHGGEGGAVPDTPTTGSDLQVCVSRNLTCCTRKMEERFQLTAWRDIQNLLHTSSTGLKLLLSRSIAGIQGEWHRTGLAQVASDWIRSD
ncbi:glypican-5-like [Hoplias malabaricus]|uniref:glypican-5-like n=1 Tax=Hoplias malabaricus TaxID=27720 RepID=UPI00346328DC